MRLGSASRSQKQTLEIGRGQALRAADVAAVFGYLTILKSGEGCRTDTTVSLR